MTDIETLTDALLAFREERDWAQFHNAKDLAIAISIESNELLEAFLWKSAEETKQEKIEEELADIFSFALLLAHEKGLDVTSIILNKIEKKGQKTLTRR
ncbi:nucleotide pyrophosphohydrolase [Paraflavitalea soli]|uniref:Nucleotide pyrophosphohydrolase n=1 Tax=Paraflavitalea soli TaxID=2315862 RepID=A0A3B7N1Z7_9BACT|nr:nucleotide pyrophosphohydrolase [Paraflavitalea soli]AXY78085.1 nucleotide pyrophosphohydrolase [Paraflavitalea soli]